ncbi:MAG: lipopolysaccharide biosynthesis protein [Gemmatimonadales bacterium]
MSDSGQDSGGRPPQGPVTSEASPSLTRSTVSGLFWTASSNGLNAVLKVVVLVVLARLLSPADFGIAGAALIVIGFSAIFSQLGLGPALVQRRDLEPRHIQTAFAASLTFGLLLAGLLWVTAPAIARFFHIEGSVDVLRALAWIFPVKGLSGVAECLVQRDLRFRWLATRDVISYALGYGLVGILLAWAGWGVWALVAAQITQTALNTAILLAFRPPALRPLPSWRAFVELMDFGAGFTVARVANFLANQGDNLVVGRMLGPQALGIYTRAYQLMAVPTTLFGDVLDRVLFPTMAKVQGDAQRLAAAYLQAVASIALVMLPLGVVLTVLAPEFIIVLLGPKWVDVIPPFQLFAIGLLFRTSYKMSDSIARATGAVYRRAWRQAIYAALVFISAWVGSRWGVAGVAVGVLVSLVINFILMAGLSLAVAQTTWRRFIEAHAPAALTALLAGGITWLTVTALRYSGAGPVLRLLGTALVTAAVMALALWARPRPLLGPYGLRMIALLGSLLPRRGIQHLRPHG